LTRLLSRFPLFESTYCAGALLSTTELGVSYGTEVIILNRPITLEPEQELVEDVLAVITVMSARMYGKRSKRNLQAMQAMHECAEKIINAEN
jgi:predicted site-specific integrase-resolvase